MTGAGTWRLLHFLASYTGAGVMQRLGDKRLVRLGTRVGVAVVLVWTVGVTVQLIVNGSGVRPIPALLAVSVGGVILFVAASSLTRSLGWALRGRARRPGQR